MNSRIYSKYPARVTKKESFKEATIIWWVVCSKVVIVTAATNNILLYKKQQLTGGDDSCRNIGGFGDHASGYTGDGVCDNKQ